LRGSEDAGGNGSSGASEASGISRQPQGRLPRRAVHGIVLLDKPLGLSSNAALQRVKRLYRAAKAGHTGSLDPLASGLLPLCFGEATKLSAYLLDADKTYRGRALLGVATTTGDAEGEPAKQSDASGVTRADLENAIPRLLGAVRQVPPMYSALKRGGRPLYELARAGIEVERAPRDIVIHELRILSFVDRVFEFEVRCSKGTYVRTLAEDWAAAIGQVAHLVGLRRIGLGPFGEVDMVPIEQLEQAAAEGEVALNRYLQPPAVAVAGWPRAVADAALARTLACGQAVRIVGAPQHGRLAVFDEAGILLGLAEIDAEGRVAPRRWLVG
jgi:tRNA pseudouridine55 synthase